MMSKFGVCGIDCSACRFALEQGCKGCQAQLGKVFWGECELYQCNDAKRQAHCGKCVDFPCAKLQEWASSENPERIDNLRNLG